MVFNENNLKVYKDKLYILLTEKIYHFYTVVSKNGAIGVCLFVELEFVFVFLDVVLVTLLEIFWEDDVPVIPQVWSLIQFLFDLSQVIALASRC